MQLTDYSYRHLYAYLENRCDNADDLDRVYHAMVRYFEDMIEDDPINHLIPLPDYIDHAKHIGLLNPTD